MSDAVGRHAVALASVREVAARAGAQRVVLLVDEGDDAVPTMVEWAEGGTFELTEGGVTEQVDPAALAGVVPAVTPDVLPLPPTALTVDAETGELAAPIGALAGIAGAIVDARHGVRRALRRHRRVRHPRAGAAARARGAPGGARRRADRRGDVRVPGGLALDSTAARRLQRTSTAAGEEWVRSGPAATSVVSIGSWPIEATRAPVTNVISTPVSVVEVTFVASPPRLLPSRR